MMGEFVELFLSAVDVIKAEARRAREGLFELVVIAGLVICGFLFLLCALGMIVAAAFFGLVHSGVTTALAALYTGVICIIIAWSLLWLGRVKSRRP